MPEVNKLAVEIKKCAEAVGEFVDVPMPDEGELEQLVTIVSQEMPNLGIEAAGAAQAPPANAPRTRGGGESDQNVKFSDAENVEHAKQLTDEMHREEEDVLLERL
jgi:hypothetical protein